MEQGKMIPNFYFEKAKNAIELYKNWLGANVVLVVPSPVNPDGVLHSVLTIGKLATPLYMSDYTPDAGVMLKDGEPRQGVMFTINLEKAEEVDAIYKKGLELGGKTIIEPMTNDWSERFAMVIDKMGISWAFNVAKPMNF